MSRRTSPRTLNSGTETTEAESFDLAYDYDEAWSAALDTSDSDGDDNDENDNADDDDYVELTQTEYDDDWDEYWRDRRSQR